MAFLFEKLKVYQKAVDFADQAASLTEGFPRGYGYLADQLNRAALSIAANLAEGNGRFTKADRRNFFVIARGSAQECVPLLELANRRGEGKRKEKGTGYFFNKVACPLFYSLFYSPFLLKVRRRNCSRLMAHGPSRIPSLLYCPATTRGDAE